MTELRYHFEPGEVRYIWLDEDDERTSSYHKSISAAYAYRKALRRVLDGGSVWSPKARRPFEPQGTGKDAVRLTKVKLVLKTVPFNDDEQLDIASAERLDRPTSRR